MGNPWLPLAPILLLLRVIRDPSSNTFRTHEIHELKTKAISFISKIWYLYTWWLVCLSLLRILVSELVETGIDIIFKTRSRANKNPYPNETHVFTQTACHCSVVAFYVMWYFPIWLVNREENKYRNVITVFQMSTVSVWLTSVDLPLTKQL